MLGRYFKRRDARLPRRQRQQGAALVLVAVCLVVMLGMLGLAIDSSMAYLSKARLSLAADSAVLAAADSYISDTSRGIDPGQRASNASNVADSYFSVNYPAPFLGRHNSKNGLYSPDPLDPPFIQYNADTEYPLTFSKVISSEMLKPTTAPVVTFKGGSSSGGVDLAIVIDSSEIMDSFRNRYSVPRAIMYNYIDKLDAANTRVSLIFAGNSSSGTSGVDIPGGAVVAVKFHPGQAGFDSNEVRLALVNNKITGAQVNQGGIRAAIDGLKKLSGDGAKKAIFYIGMSEPQLILFGGGSPTQELVDVAREAHQDNISMYVLGWEASDSLSTSRHMHYLTDDVSANSVDGKPIKWSVNDLLTCIAGDPRSPTPKNCPIRTSTGNKRCSANLMDDLSGFEACLPDTSGSGPGPSLMQAVLTQ